MPGALTHDPITVGGGLHQTPTGDVQAGPDGVARALTASQVAAVSVLVAGAWNRSSLTHQLDNGFGVVTLSRSSANASVVDHAGLVKRALQVPAACATWWPTPSF